MELVMERKYQRKVHQQGNSLSVGIPSQVAERLKLKKGETLEVEFNEETQELLYRKVKAVELPKGFDIEFLEVLNGVLEDYDEALINLKDR
ncbi:AbrB/MazE/SpoVT family DNA-binding domain-containing protein [Cytobacillus depressus]|uniref:AbrB/MazE/SpoVT family DNA-binding domain-containing protein n=1 Tax=Cytobacillus depressus TaxID=1602942 RepID=A0A6L3V0D0_9BACI|nr:AbrB/MazE/SpoVT family DNA-binding domain-containing protein [Cytobacillus depressus]KAB2328917.1 AbrB/MazE/SpoVT family DNA-binding domain-containing protein [Cytobacillus depressus]